MSQSQGLSVDARTRLGHFALHATLHVPPGLTALFGPSGAGKSLTLQLIAGLAPASEGRVTLDERTLVDTAAGVSLPAGARRIGYVPQSYALFPHLTVAGNVGYALPGSRLPWDHEAQARRAKRVSELLALVRLEGYEQRWPRQLSGGQAQRVALARALAASPQALLLDEPLAALDGPTRVAVRDDLRALALASGIPALVVTHDLAEARALSDRLALLIDGRVVAEGPTADVLTSPPTAAAALLLGWRNTLPIVAIAPDGLGAVCVTLPGGQRLRVAGVSSSPAANVSLALNADRLELRAAGNGDADEPANRLRGHIERVTDYGAYTLVRVALDGAKTTALEVTCSPREWASLSTRPGDAVGVVAPADSTRVVARN